MLFLNFYKKYRKNSSQCLYLAKKQNKSCTNIIFSILSSNNFFSETRCYSLTNIKKPWIASSSKIELRSGFSSLKLLFQWILIYFLNFCTQNNVIEMDAGWESHVFHAYAQRIVQVQGMIRNSKLYTSVMSFERLGLHLICIRLAQIGEIEFYLFLQQK